MYGFAIHHLFEYHTIIFYSGDGERDIACTLSDAPFASLSTRDSAVGIELNINRSHLFIVFIIHTIFVNQQLVCAHNLVDCKRLFCCYVCISNLLTIIFERCNHKPSIAIHKHLVGAHAVPNGVVVKLGVINKVSSTIVGSNDAVMSLRTFAHSHESPMVVSSHQLFATSVAIVAIVHHV